MPKPSEAKSIKKGLEMLAAQQAQDPVVTAAVTLIEEHILKLGPIDADLGAAILQMTVEALKTPPPNWPRNREVVEVGREWLIDVLQRLPSIKAG